MCPSSATTKIGRYRVEERLGSGGMGDVYLGYDETLERKVALKCINAENRLDDEAKGRFLREAKVLSQLGHPDICQIYDYIEGDDADYLVLELIEGVKSGDFIRKNDLSLRQILLLAKRIANVLALAHEKGIIHRDLKPDNVLVSGDGGVKVLDFGLARQLGAVEAQKDPEVPRTGKRSISTDRTISLESGISSSSSVGKNLTTVGLIMGTLGYMSPEQARGEDVSPFSDMYSFGILLEEMISGRSSFDKELSFESLLEKNQLGERVPVQVEEQDIASLIKDLTAIEPNARLTARETVRRIDDILEKPARKRKRIIVSSVIAILAVSAVISTVLWMKASSAEKKAVDEAEAAKQVSDFLVGLFEVSDPSEARGNEITAKEVLHRGVEKIDSELKDQPAVQSRMMMTMGTVYSKLGLYREAGPLLDKSLSIREEAFGKESLEVAESLAEASNLTGIEGKFKEAEALQRRALEIRMKELGPESDEVAASLNNIGEYLAKQDKWEEANDCYARSLKIREKNHGPNHPDTATVLNNIGHLYNRKGSLDEAETNYKKALDVWSAAYGPVHPQVALGLNNLAQTYKKQGKFGEAESYYKKALDVKEKLYGKDHPSVATTLNNLGALYFSEKKYDEAFDFWTRSMAIISRKFEADSPSLGLAYNNLGMALKAKKDYQAALENYEKALSIFRKAYSVDSIEAAKTLNNIAGLHSTLKNWKDAEAAFREAIAISEKKLGPIQSTTFAFRMNLFQLYSDSGDRSRAEKVLLELFEELRSTKNPDTEKVKMVADYLYWLYESTGQKEKAVKYYRAADKNKK